MINQVTSKCKSLLPSTRFFSSPSIVARDGIKARFSVWSSFSSEWPGKHIVVWEGERNLFLWLCCTERSLPGDESQWDAFFSGWTVGSNRSNGDVFRHDQIVSIEGRKFVSPRVKHRNVLCLIDRRCFVAWCTWQSKKCPPLPTMWSLWHQV